MPHNENEEVGDYNSHLSVQHQKKTEKVLSEIVKHNT